MRTINLVTGGVTALAVVLTAVPASAADGDAQANAIADVVADASPSGDSVAPAATAGSTEATYAAAGTELAVSLDPGEPVVIESQGLGLEIGLPDEIDVSEGVVADDGTVVFEDPGGDAHAAVQALTDGSVRLQTVLENPDAPSTYTYNLGDGVELVLLDDGSVEIAEPMGDGVVAVAGTIDVPWAVDADGVAVPTYYTVEGSDLTQHVILDPDTAFPVTADPRISVGWFLYLKYSKSEVRRYWSGTEFLNTAAAAAACAAAGPYSAAICGSLTAGWFASIGSTFRDAKRYGQCVEIAMTVGGIPVKWKRYSC